MSTSQVSETLLVAEPRAHPMRWWVLGVMSVSLLTIVLNNSVLNVAMPTLVLRLGASTTQLQWIVDSYSVVFAGLLLTAGALSDRLGRKRTTLSGLVLFGLGSALASLASGAGLLIVARCVMAVGAAFVMPGTLSVLVHVFPERERQRAIAVWGAVSALGVAIGPVLGGLLVRTFGWSSVFLLNVPIVVVAVAVGLVVVPESRDPTRRIDLPGALLAAAAMCGTVFIVIGAARSWHGWLTATAVVLACGAFVWWERRSPHPLVELSLLRSRRFAGASLSNMLLVFGLAGVLFVLTQRLQFALGFDALRAGLAVAPVAVAVFAGTAVSGRLSALAGNNRAIGIGMALVTAGVLVIAWSSAYPPTLAGLLLMGIGFGCAMAPTATEMMAAVPAERSGVGSAINDTMQELGYALGVAVIGTVLTHAYTEGLGAAPPGASDSVGTALHIAALRGGPAGAALAHTARTAFAHGTATGLTIGALVVLIGAVIGAVMLRRGRTAERKHHTQLKSGR